jgi:hypothetical protein
LLIRPERSVSPDWYFFGVSPNSGPARECQKFCVRGPCDGG